MRNDFEKFDLGAEDEGSGGTLGTALLALALGAGAALLFAPTEGARTRRLVRGGAEIAVQRVRRELRRREETRRRQRWTSALAGLAVGAGLAALLVPESGPNTRRRLVDTIKRRKAEAVAEVDRVVREPQAEPVVSRES